MASPKWQPPFLDKVIGKLQKWQPAILLGNPAHFDSTKTITN
jgi:hypothetical protein